MDHEAIIDKKVFDTVGELLKKNKNKPTGNNIMLLSGFMKCKECGHKIGINKSSDGKRYYTHCSYYTSHSKYGLCTPHSLNYKKLENLVLEEIRKLCKEYVDSTTFKERIESIEKESTALDKADANKDILEKINEYLRLEKPTRALLVNLIDKILISEDKTIEIHYKFKLY